MGSPLLGWFSPLLYYCIDPCIVCWAHLNHWLELLDLLILATHVKSGMILVLSFLFKGESFSFVRGLWLLDLSNRKTFLVEILGSPFHLVFLDGDWKVVCFLAFGKFLWDLYLFRESLSCLQEGDFSLSVFAGAPQLAWIGLACIRGFSLVSLRSMISSCYFSVASCFFLMMQQIWYG